MLINSRSSKNNLSYRQQYQPAPQGFSAYNPTHFHTSQNSIHLAVTELVVGNLPISVDEAVLHAEFDIFDACQTHVVMTMQLDTLRDSATSSSISPMTQSKLVLLSKVSSSMAARFRFTSVLVSHH